MRAAIPGLRVELDDLRGRTELAGWLAPFGVLRPAAFMRERAIGLPNPAHDAAVSIFASARHIAATNASRNTVNATDTYRTVARQQSDGTLKVWQQKVDVVGRCCGVKPRVVCVPEALAIAGSALMYRFHLGPLHPEQYLIAGKEFVLSLDHTFSAFGWRPTRAADEIVEDAVRAQLAGG